MLSDSRLTSACLPLHLHCYTPDRLPAMSDHPLRHNPFLSFLFANNEQKALLRMLVGSLIAIAIPVICCLFAFLLTLVAAKKKGMVLPVLLLIIAIIENLFLIRSFDQILQFAGSFATKGTKVPDITLLVGIFAFTLFCAIALELFCLHG